MVASDRIGSIEITVFEDDIVEVVIREGWRLELVYWPIICIVHYFRRQFGWKCPRNLYPYDTFILADMIAVSSVVSDRKKADS